MQTIETTSQQTETTTTSNSAKGKRYRNGRHSKAPRSSSIDIMATTPMSEVFRGADESEGSFIGFSPYYILDFDYSIDSYTSGFLYSRVLSSQIYSAFQQKFEDIFRVNDALSVAEFQGWFNTVFKAVRDLVAIRYIQYYIQSAGEIERETNRTLFDPDVREAIDDLENELAAQYFPPSMVKWLKWLYHPMQYGWRTVQIAPTAINPAINTPAQIISTLEGHATALAVNNNSIRKVRRVYTYNSKEAAVVDTNVTLGSLDFNTSKHDIWGHRFYNDTLNYRPDVAGVDSTWRFMLSSASSPYYVGANLPFFDSTNNIEESFTFEAFDLFFRLNENGTYSAALTGEYTPFGFQNLTNAGATNQIQPHGAYPIYYSIRNQRVDGKRFLVAALDLQLIGLTDHQIKVMAKHKDN